MDPKISIITVVRNGEKFIEDTIQSILSQTYRNVEYLIIDGKSSDNTVNIIRKYEDRINYWISEKDTGIYDAMNKGVRASTGDWILFINSDDFLIGNTVIQEASEYLAKCKNRIAYGNVIFEFGNGVQKIYGGEWKHLADRFRNVAMSIPHQATFHSKALFSNEFFDPTFRIAGDYDFLLRHLKKNDATYLPVTIAKMRAGGLSHSVSKIELLKDTRKAQLKNKIYKLIPSFSWHVSALKLLIVDSIIRLTGLEGKNKLKRILRM